jgi:hypothetical protein
MFGKAPEDWRFEDPPLVGVGRKSLLDIMMMGTKSPPFLRLASETRKMRLSGVFSKRI